MASTIDVIEQVRAQIAPLADADKSGDLDFAIAQLIPVALRTLAEKVAGNEEPALREYFQQTFNCAITANVASFASHLVAAEPLLISCPFPEVSHASVSRPFLYVGGRTLLSFSDSYDFGYYTIVDTDILLKPPTGVSLTGNVIVLANFVPSLANVPAQVLPYLVKIIVSMLSRISIKNESRPSLLANTD